VAPPAPKSRDAVRAALANPPARAGSSFLWPVQGPLLSSYGAKSGGEHNDGINIAAPRGTAVRAAENGVVAYAGEELKGFGRLLLVKHADGWVTAYAHNEDLLVAAGDRVTRGQTIARVGSSGHVDRPQLHFEVRRGTRAVNPEAQLSPRTASAAD
jgi:murein DD-endopeptidase MepM/ murein hydrolase activator NlpD